VLHIQKERAMLYPLRFHPLYFEKVWGGRKLETVLGRTLPPDEPIGESWEISDHPHGRGVVANGPEAGNTLQELIAHYGAALLGKRVFADNPVQFPLLVKYLDAQDKLSVQVHPNDAYAAAHAGELGKSEMWYVLHAEPNSCLIAGLHDGVTAEQFRDALTRGDPGQLLYHLPVSTGDSLFIPAGRIHAIMPGLLILEIQQNSDTTYRLYDWGRLGLDGQPRALHIDQALAVANWTDFSPLAGAEPPLREGRNTSTELAACQYFVVKKYDLKSAQTFQSDGSSFQILNCVAGNGVLRWEGGCEKLSFGDSLLLPAELTRFTIQPESVVGIVLSSVPS
jgi:mannose-6-phosphate isomerase